MTDDRSEMQANRAADLAKRHERRLAHAQVVMATDIPMQSGEENPFRALVTALALSSNDWGSARDFAWIYGIVCGWSDEGDDAWPEQQRKWSWTDEQVARLKALHVKFHAAAWEETP